MQTAPATARRGHHQWARFCKVSGVPIISSQLGGIGAEDARYKRYAALDDDGICRVGVKLNDQYIMINREMPIEDRDLPQGQSLTSRGGNLCVASRAQISWSKVQI